MNDPSDSRRVAPKDVALDGGLQPGLHVEVVHEDGDWSAFEPIEDAASAIAAEITRKVRLAAPAMTACVALSSDARVAELNARYRGKAKPTNVLSFPASYSSSVSEDGAVFVGDIVLALETVCSEADAQAILPGDHLRHLLAHGLLHLLGFDHETEQEARSMERLEVEILAALGVADPYADDELDSTEAQPAANVAE